MLINPEEINKILSVTESDIINRGKKYFEQSRVKIEDCHIKGNSAFRVKTCVQGQSIYKIDILKEKGTVKYKCDCPTFLKKHVPCKHIIATFFDIYINPESYTEFHHSAQIKVIDNSVIENKTYRQIKNEKFKNSGLISYYEKLNANLDGTEAQKVNIIPKITISGLNDSSLEVTFKIGRDRLYLLKDIYEFAENMMNDKVSKYGKTLEFENTLDNYSEDSNELAKFICNYASFYFKLNHIASYEFNIHKSFKNTIHLEYNTLDEFFDIMKGKKIEIDNYDTNIIECVIGDPILNFNVIEDESVGLNILDTSEKYRVYHGQTSVYVLYQHKLYQCSQLFKENVLPLIQEFKQRKNNCIKIQQEEATNFCEYLIPAISGNSHVEVSSKILETHKADKLGTKVYLDIDDKSNIIAQVKFCYGNDEFNPFDKMQVTKCNRNTNEESKAMKLFQEYEFVIDVKDSILSLTNEDTIYRFLTEGIYTFMDKFEVLVTDRLKNKQIINNKILNIGVRVQNDLIRVDLGDLEISEAELKEIFKRYQLKKKYYRLKNGTYLNLENTSIDTLVNLNQNLGVTEKELSGGSIKLPKYRAFYLENLLKQKLDINVEEDNVFNNIIHDLQNVNEARYEIPEIMEHVLRPYQKTGYNWLKNLEYYHFGGILADDMGLGKTIQIIALLADEKVKGTNTTSIVVCPSSLYINWQKEINKFAPNINILVVSGMAEARKELIKEATKYDVILTSYDLLKRDIEYYKEINFQYAIADEAQYIKNNNTKNSKALKKIKAKTRFALTGTPIENSLSELWSIFDFVMPGYLFSYNKFKEQYEQPIIKENDEQVLDKLQKIVAPFILRRIKKDVLKELPDKTETIMYSKMQPEQEKIYNAFLTKAKMEMEEDFENIGFEKSKMKILALITRLRQICCHPSLFIREYGEGSSKLEQCMQIIKDATSAGHKILLFSGFTSMFDIITKELEKENINYLMLTGNTKVDTRIEMVEKFNKSEDVKIFLISLKAGGTGLNLTGADIVIHYDPWWNLSAQNQATDRAYRIGQKNNVQVFKLITQNSIEEKILNLQNVKMELTNSVITGKETFISKMSKEEIIDLFNN
ncbi:MAG: DEAD/DEAH box helicase [Clostridia bacterium]|nr:DEAD/DEAH box helicase [Clostridia bacterium]